METIWICGLQTDAGMHLQNELSREHRVLGDSRPIGQSSLRLSDSSTLVQKLQSEGVTRVIYCGEAAQSSWNTERESCRDTTNVSHWATVCSELQIPLLFVSSDAVFTGPWMFHDETDECFCSSARATSIREQEKIVLDRCDAATVVRTHIIGWNDSQLMQAILHHETLSRESFDAIAHATPIYADLFARLIAQLLETDVRGILHLAGAERVSPRQWLTQLADLLGKASIRGTSKEITLEQPSSGFGDGECSLQSTKARRLLGTGMPSLMDSLDAMKEDWISGRIQHFTDTRPLALPEVA